MDRSAMPMCIAMLQNQAKNRMCQKPNFDCPSNGTPVHILLCATPQNSLTRVTPNSGNTAMAAAKNTSTIQGAALFAIRATSL